MKMPICANSDIMFKTKPVEAEVSGIAGEMYVKRYLDFFPSACMAGMKIGVYQHSAVGRELLVQIYEGLGADVVPLGFEMNHDEYTEYIHEGRKYGDQHDPGIRHAG